MVSSTRGRRRTVLPASQQKAGDQFLLHVAHVVSTLQDEELEHMQWQLDKRTHGDGAGADNNGDQPSRSSSRHRAASRRRLVFHDRHNSRNNHHQQRQLHPSTANGSISIRIDTGTSSDEAAVSSNFVDQQHQQQLDAHAGQDPSEQFYCLHLDHAAAAQDVNKAQERLAKHIKQVGWGTCAGAAAAAESQDNPALLTELPGPLVYTSTRVVIGTADSSCCCC